MYLRAQPKKASKLPLFLTIATGWILVALAVAIQIANN